MISMKLILGLEGLIKSVPNKFSDAKYVTTNIVYNNDDLNELINAPFTDFNKTIATTIEPNKSKIDRCVGNYLTQLASHLIKYDSDEVVLNFPNTHLFNCVGYKWNKGILRLHGNAGNYVAEDQAGGRIIVEGDAVKPAFNKTGGLLVVKGSVVDFNYTGLLGGLMIVSAKPKTTESELKIVPASMSKGVLIANYQTNIDTDAILAENNKRLEDGEDDGLYTGIVISQNQFFELSYDKKSGNRVIQHPDIIGRYKIPLCMETKFLLEQPYFFEFAEDVFDIDKVSTRDIKEVIGNFKRLREELYAFRKKYLKSL